MEKMKLKDGEDPLMSASPVLTDVVNNLIQEIYGGKLTFTLFLSDGEKSGLSGNNDLNNTFDQIRKIEEHHKNNTISYIDMNGSGKHKH